MLSSKTFDPYHKWLGIRPEEQPANYYRLLGIALFEDDADAIAGAADQRMAHVRSFQAGNYAALSQRILNEIAAARVCLLTPQNKAVYDQALRTRFTPPSPPVELPVDDIPDLGYSSTYKQHKKSTPSWMPWAFVGVGGLVVVIIFTVIAKSGRDEQAVAKAPTTSMPQPASPKIEPKKVTPKVEAKPQPKDKERADSEPITDTPPSETKLEPAKLKLVVLKNPDPLPEVEAPKTKEPAKSQPEQPLKTKLPIPDDAAQEQVMATIRDIYKDDYKDKTALARKLIQKANETQNATDRFVLLQEAKDLASETWQGQVAFEAIDAMANEYDISSPDMKAAVIEQAAKKPRITAEQKTAIANAALQVVDEAIGEDKFDVAKKAGRIASQLVRQTKDKDLLQEVVAKGKQVGAAAKAYADAQEAIATLKDKPDDPDANVAVGKYLCFNKGNWAKGLPMLAKGSDDTFKALATKDVAGAASAGEQVKLGDAWWGVSTERASYWYEQALPGLTGLEKDRVAKRAVVKTSNENVFLADLNPQEVKVIESNIHRSATFKGQISPHTLWAHPLAPKNSSHIVYELNKSFQTLRGAAGIGHEGIPESPLTFRIVGDGRLLWKSRPVQVSDESQNYDIDISRVKRLELFVDCPGGTGHCWGIWIDPVVTKTVSEKRTTTNLKMTYLSDLQAQEVQVWDTICREEGYRGKVSPHNLWAHPPAANSSSHIAYQLDGQFRTLKGAAGIGSVAAGRTRSPLTFRIVGGGKLLWKSSPTQATDEAQSFCINIGGVKKLELFVDCPGANNWASAIWIDPVLTGTTSEKVGVKK